MLTTLIRDAYAQSEAGQIAKALDEICSPTDSYGWSSAGVYVFWNVDSREILYIGLAVDLAQRFRQHNGLIKCSVKGCKIEKIREYFTKKKLLGYSVFVQSPLDQPFTAKLVKKFPDLDIDDLGPLPGGAGQDTIKFLEGNLIQAQFLRNAVLPPWNKISGGKEGKQNAKPGHESLAELASRGRDSMVARATLREIAADPEIEGFEENLHAARIMQLNLGATIASTVPIGLAIEKLVELVPVKRDVFGRIVSSKYWSRPTPFEVP